jgi:hypothetical protein
MGDYRLQMTTFHRTRVVTRRSAARIIAAIKAAHIVIPGSFLEHPLCWPAFQRLVVCLPFSGRHHTHITGHAIHGATDLHAKKFAETLEDDGPLVQFGYWELVIEEIGTPACSPLNPPGREVDDKAHGDRIRLVI